MDDFSDILHCSYPLFDPHGYSLNLLTEVATELYFQERSLIPCIKIKDHVKPKETVKNNANEALKRHGFPVQEPTNKPNNNFMGSVFEIGASSSLKIQLHSKKTMKNYANQVLKEDRSLEEEASKKGKKPFNYMDSETEASTTRNHEVVINNIYSFEKDDHVLKMKKRNGLKRTHEIYIIDEESIDVIDDVNQEWVPCESSKKKRKNSKGCGNNKREKAKQVSEDTAETTPPDLPDEFKNKINEMGGNQITLVIQKKLYQTDLSPQHNRLSMPLKQIKNASFLREEELQVLEGKQGIEVSLLYTSFELRNVTLAKWDMTKFSGSINSSYVLRSSWMKVAAANQLELNDVVQIWSFRVQEELYMALVKV